jgi:two-component system, cell cycle response regulator DivK
MKIILIVEDYEDTREMMNFLLKDYGYEVLEAADGDEAIACFVASHPDLILMDISMPGMDGLTATRSIRDTSFGKDIPIIAITAFGNLYSQKAIDAGCTEVIGKPLDIDDLSPLLERYLPIQ